MDIGARTERARFTFTVKEYHDGTPWIAFEPLDENLPDLGDSFLGFDLRSIGNDKAAYDRAVVVARYLNENVDMVTHLVFEKQGRHAGGTAGGTE